MAEKRPRSTEEVLEHLQRFACTAWNDPNAFRSTLRRGPSHVFEYLDLHEHFHAMVFLFGDLFKTEKMVVREEYRDALQALKNDRVYRSGAYIVGQPGIGKTYCLLYLLIERLREHKPVAFQSACHPFYVLFTDTIGIYSTDDYMSLWHSDAWCLTDSNSLVTNPARAFRSSPTLRIIQATSPNVDRWERWSRDAGARQYLMKV